MQTSRPLGVAFRMTPGAFGGTMPAAVSALKVHGILVEKTTTSNQAASTATVQENTSAAPAGAANTRSPPNWF